MIGCLEHYDFGVTLKFLIYDVDIIDFIL